MRFLELFLTFFMIGAVTFGGGYAMLPMIQEQVAQRWGDLIPAADLINFVAVSESTPGPFAVNMATYVGSVVGGSAGGIGSMIFGAFCTTMGVTLPSFIVILIVAKCYDKFKNSRLVKGAMSGLKPAVVGLIGGAIWSVVMTVFFPMGISVTAFGRSGFYVSLVIFAGMLFLAMKKKLHPILIVCISAVAGIAAGYLGLL